MVPTQGQIWVDGYPASALPLPDRGLDFGDGIFETLLLLEGKPLYLDLHLQRLQQGLLVLGFPNCLDEVSMQIHRALSAGDFAGEFVMRVTVTRGAGPRGYLPPSDAKPRVIIAVNKRTTGSFTQMPAPAHLALANIRWGSQPQLAGIKHLNRLEQVMAARERKAAGVDEVLMLAQQGQVISVSAGNLFIREADGLVTPALVDCGVHGTRRRLIMEKLAPALGLQVREAEIGLAQLEAAEEVFFCNALVGVCPVGSFAGARWQRHDTCAALHQLMCQGGQ